MTECVAGGSASIVAITSPTGIVATSPRGAVMNWDEIKGNWSSLKGKIRERWGKLTDDEVEVIAGKRDQLVGKLQRTYGITREEAERQADDWRGGLK